MRFNLLGQSDEDALLDSVEQKTESVASFLRKSSITALIICAGFTGYAHGQSRDSEAATPVIQEVQESDVEALYEDAKKIANDESFEAGDIERDTVYAEQLADQFDSVSQEVRRLINNEDYEAANDLLDVLETSIQNASYNVTMFLDFVKDRDDPLPKLTKSLDEAATLLVDLQKQVDHEKNLVNNMATDSVDDIKAYLDQAPGMSYEVDGDYLLIHVIGESERLSNARAMATNRLHGVLHEYGLEGETSLDIDQGGDEITVTATTRIPHGG